jgi:hypothetical protein
MDFCRTCQCGIAITLCTCITIDVAAYGLRDYVCWSPLRAASACAVPEGVLPHIEYPDAPPSLAMDNISVIASTGTMYHPLYFPQPPASSTST